MTFKAELLFAYLEVFTEEQSDSCFFNYFTSALWHHINKKAENYSLCWKKPQYQA